MTVASYEQAEPLDLIGDAYARGRAQAALCPDLVEHVRHAIAHRLEQTAAALAREEVRQFIDAQRQTTEMFDREILEEIRGIADGFGIAPATLFDYLHCSSAMDIADLQEHRPDGCTSIAMTAGRPR